MTRARGTAGGILAALLACSVTSPETQVKEALAGECRLELLGVGRARVTLERLRFSDVTVAMDGPRALVVAMVEADGRALAGPGETALVYVGRETFQMERCGTRTWCLADGTLPALRDAITALAAAPRPSGTRVLAWQIRAERDGATAGEDYEERAGADVRRLRRRWELARGREGWRIVAR